MIQYTTHSLSIVTLGRGLTFTVYFYSIYSEHLLKQMLALVLLPFVLDFPFAYPFF